MYFISNLFIGLNCHSMLKYTTLVLTVSAVRRIEERILFNTYNIKKKFEDDEFVEKTFLT